MNFFKKLFKRPEPEKPSIAITPYIKSYNCEVLLTRGWVGADIVKKNIKTVWVRLIDNNIIIRRNREVRYE